MTNWPTTYLDGQWIDPSTSGMLPLINRGLLFGDGLFETIRVFQSKVPFWPQHQERLRKGCAFLGLDLPDAFEENFQRDILTKFPRQIPNARIRLTVFRKGEGKYTPPTREAHYLVQWNPLENNFWSLPETGLKVGKYRTQATPSYPLCQHKTLSALPYVLASQFRANSIFDEVLLANHRGEWVEASSSNLFCFWRGSWYTPPVEAGCLSGTTRAVLISTMQALGWPIEVTSCTEQMLREAEHLWLSNSIQGVRWVASLRLASCL
ncbi:MAG: aminotransferase class IV [Bacteroidota bacterium]